MEPLFSKRKALLALLAAPFLGLAFIIFLPILGFLLTGKALLAAAHARSQVLWRKVCEGRQKA